MSDFYDAIQEDENARQSNRVRAYPPSDRSNRSVPTNQTSQIREPSRRTQRPQPARRPQPGPTQQQPRYASEQNLSSSNGNGRRQVPGGSGPAADNPYRYNSQASIASSRNPYLDRANESKPSSNNRPGHKVGTWEEEEDDYEYSSAASRSQPPPAQPRQQQPPSRFQNQQQQEASVNQPDPIRTFASDLRQELEETSDILRGRTQGNSAASARPAAKPAANQFHVFELDDDEDEQAPRQTAQPQQQARPELRQNGSYSAFGHQEQQQQERPDRNMYYGSNRNREGPPSDGRREPREKREKFKPSVQNVTELFDERMHIQKGDRFDEVYGLDKDFDDVQVTGGDDTKPRIESFDQCNFSPQILKNLKILKFSKPTPIQKYVIPLVQRKTNSIMGNAETGSGKTAAFMLPIINEIQRRKDDMGFSSKGGLPYCLVLEPTRDLAEQVNRDTKAFACQTGVVVTVTYGETNVHEAKREIERGCDILVMTIGRLHHFLEDGIIKLTQMHYLILDETDKLLKSQFETVIVNKIIKSPDLKPDYRTFMFSATIDEDVQRFISKITINQKFIKVGKYDKEDFLLEILRDSESTIKREVPGDGEKFEYIPERTVVFVAHKRQSDRVAISLAREGFNVISLNSDRTAKQRWEAIYKYKMNTYQVLVATDVASRGLNLPEVQHVINLDLPMTEYMSYIHRIGRTGRAGNTGHATSFFDPNCAFDIDNTPFYVQTLQTAKIQVPDFMQEIVDSRDQTVHALNRVDPRSAQQNWD
uniref:RNA helicase n=1 Tax=Ditylenchus dipsaci TaxID=166011 RepID=A0A915CWI4_9BILA